MLGDSDDAEDAAQETFVRAWRALPRFEGASLFSTWLTRIAINQCRNELRRRRTVKHARPLSLDERIPGTEIPRRDSLVAPGADGYETSRGAEVRRAFDSALAEVDAEDRTVLVLREVEDLSCEEIAETLALPIGTVKSRIHRGRLILRDLLREERIAVDRAQAG